MSDPAARGGQGAQLWLVRHGQSSWNVAGRIQGQSPRAGSLTPTGRDQAELAARQLAGLAPDAELIVASDLARTAETAAIIAGRLGLPLEFDPGLREQDLGTLEGTGSAGGDGQTDVIDQFWDEPYRRPPGGESVAELYGRVQGTLLRLAAARPGAELIVVTHGGPVRVATASSLPPPGSPLPRAMVGNASITPWPGSAHTEMVAP
ncbi:MAG TPA: histidine phosphatase family protein [Streptosporangiaceae bacterium]|jgi:probable phosphoglycerate mutase|nr:histidine phosphatase family protein [Streptosporangiaceae bacterium]